MCSNLSEIIFSNAFLDLSFNSSSLKTSTFEEKGIRIKSESSSMLFKKEIKKAKADIGNNIHVIHRFFENGNEHAEKKITEFLTHQVYGCEVIITNVSSKKRNFQLLWQIPAGSLPLLDINYQKSENHNLEAYSTTTFTYYFYFTQEGEFIQFPSNVSDKNTVVAVSNTHKFKVVNTISKVVIETFKDILMTGNNEAVFNYLRTENLLQKGKGFSLNSIYWMLKEKPVYEEIIKILRERRIYVTTVWQFGFFHQDYIAIKGKLLLYNYI